NSSYLERLQHQRFIVTGGAPLSKPIGDVINSRTRIHNWVATTETGNLQQLEVPQKDWEYVSFGPHSGAEFRPHSGDLRELVVVRNQMLEHYQGVFHNFPNLQEYPTNDIYSQHSDPQKSDLWLYRGRADDVIVFSNGEKMNPISMELTIGSDPEVRSALVLGQDRFQAALLIEPEDSLGEEERYGLIERLWPKIQQANEHCPAHGRLSKSHVMLTSKSMVRTDKGSVNRNATAKIYLEELDSLYREQPDKNADSRAHSPLRQTIAESTLLDINQIQDDDNLFTHGMDSLHVIRLARELSTNEKQIEPGTFYRNPTISKLASALQSEDTPPSVRIPKMDAMLQKYSMNLPKRKPRIAMLTGVTGSIGKYLLRDLVNSGQFSKIYCLCRTLQPSTPDVTFLQCDFSDPLLGLPYEIYTELLSSVTDILHSAWQVDFNLPLENFEPHVRGVRHFIDFSSRSKNRAHIFFISSVGSIMNSTSDIVEEQIFDDCSIAQPMGYGESKYIAERLLYLAGIESNVSSTICRVGQIAGPLDDSGMWKKCEWIPSIIATSKFLGCIPASLGPSERITWIPVDKFSQIVMELFTSEVKETTEVLHLINPSATTWTELVPVVQSNLGSDIKVVPLPEWVHALQESVSNVENPDWNPAAKFTDLLQSLVQEQTRKFPILDTTNAVRQSQSLRELGAIRSEWMTHWIKQWAF
ncbi:hypothetical protein MMC12_008428, partial [Toensbergia leucococca]|nr:hypothetical protein [Toensbergia leucococca]